MKMIFNITEYLLYVRQHFKYFSFLNTFKYFLILTIAYEQ